ncbi:MAG TPA: alanine--tRNA ligase-related protein [Ktedonobacteraceae bacterium]|nr:alanine--tRNA ligase-related protein [Ktedonobacteraceae bacterium]
MTINGTRYLSSTEIAERYLAFFSTRDHKVLSASPLVLPGNSTSFTIAGMQPLLPYLRGEVEPPYPRLTALQRCLRSDDADAVGSNERKNTSFHMLGQWSINDYGKREAITMAWELLVNEFGLDPADMWATVFEGDAELCILPDEVAIEQWTRLGVQPDHIVSLGAEDNLWTIGGSAGPCGPCSEIYIDRGLERGCGSPGCRPGCDCDRFLEIWSLVFMEYELHTDGKISSLPLHNIDTGMGLERMASVLQNAESVYAIDLFQPALQRLLELAPVGVAGGGAVEARARRMIVDHMRAFLLVGVEGVLPGRDGRNSVVRRLIRRAARQGRLLGIDRPFLGELLEPLAQGHGSLLTPDERRMVGSLVRIVTQEETMFERVLSVGLRSLAQIEPEHDSVVSGAHLFTLHAEKGFPADLAAEVLAERGLSVDWSAYELALEGHRQVSRQGAEQHFKSGSIQS